MGLVRIQSGIAHFRVLCAEERRRNQQKKPLDNIGASMFLILGTHKGNLTGRP